MDFQIINNRFMSGFQYIWIDLLAVVKISQTSKIYKIYGKKPEKCKIKRRLLDSRYDGYSNKHETHRF